MIYGIVLFLLILSITVWLFGFFYTNLLSLPSLNINQYKKILLVFAHPDDEVMFAGGLTQQANSRNIKTTLLVLTKGEKGTPNAHLEQNLKKIREDEVKKVAKVIKINNLILKDLGDGKLIQKDTEIQKEISQVLQTEKPDLVITHDPSGMYGHNDHIAVSNAVTSVYKKDKSKFSLWYITLPKKVLNMHTLPEYMAKDKDFTKNRAYPTHKLFTGFETINKIKGVYLYKSQYNSFRGTVPKPMPIWFAYSFMTFEYFYEVK